MTKVHAKRTFRCCELRGVFKSWLRANCLALNRRFTGAGGEGGWFDPPTTLFLDEMAIFPLMQVKLCVFYRSAKWCAWGPANRFPLMCG
jgi:hypothetical protein